MAKEINKDEQKMLLMGILMHLDNFCRNNGIEYTVGYGTMLGAIRHGGFIPWDDDVDVFMRRKDYERFRERYHSERYPFLDITIDNDHPVEMGKLYDATTYIYTYNTIRRNYGLFIDIFPLENITEDDVQLNKWLKKIKIYMALNHIMNSNLDNNNTFLILRKSIKILAKTLPLKNIVHRKLERLFKKFGNIDTKFVGCPMFIWTSKETGLLCTKRYTREIFDEYMDVSFEGKSVRIIKDYDVFLRQCYRDYMQLPPLEKRVGSHSINAFYK